MIIYRQVIVKQYRKYTHTKHGLRAFFITFLVLSPLLDPDPYQSSPWIRFRNEFVHILDPDPDPYQNDTDPPHLSALLLVHCTQIFCSITVITVCHCQIKQLYSMVQRPLRKKVSQNVEQVEIIFFRFSRIPYIFQSFFKQFPESRSKKAFKNDFKSRS